MGLGPAGPAAGAGEVGNFSLLLTPYVARCALIVTLSFLLPIACSAGTSLLFFSVHSSFLGPVWLCCCFKRQLLQAVGFRYPLTTIQIHITSETASTV